LDLIDSLGPLEISDEIMEDVYQEARKAFPIECCGWLFGSKDGTAVSGVRRCTNDQSSGGHPSTSDRTGETAYNITGSELLDLNNSLDTPTPARVIYHSHPNGQAYFSPTDREVATSPWGDGPAFPVQQLVVGINDQRVVEAALFAWSEKEAGFVEIARYEGANI
jgi:proteasome lid subunit RPN8/RPN11